MMRIGLVGLGLTMAGCAMQAPAPVTSGYGQPTAVVAQTEPAYQTVEPAAGPVAQVSQQTKIAAGVPSSAPRITLPTPSILGDMGRSIKPAAAPKTGWYSYQLQRGDTIYRLSREFNASPEAILKANGMASAGDMTEGQVVMVPVGIGRFAKAGTVPVVPVVATQAVETPVNDVAAVEPAAAPVASNVVSGPSGTRYSLTRHETVASKGQTVQMASKAAPSMVEEDLVKVEPAAGPTQAVTVATQTGDVQVTMHTVQAGETVYRIAQKYGASVLDIMNANDLETPQALKAGMAIKVPFNKGTKPTAATEPVADEGVKVASMKPSTVTDVKADLYKGKVDAAAARAKGMVWPVRGEVTNRFGSEGAGVSQTGINIKVPANTPVIASDAGTVVYADNALKNYGNLVLLRHSNGTVTAYAHNNALLVAKGERVKKGQTIALSGNTGNVKEAMLHFEVRRDARAVDPMSVLPR
ncbi:MAG: peptidoglycan DD-metalloendopeptidase family protein [Alphaproteobacteria bacterium]